MKQLVAVVLFRLNLPIVRIERSLQILSGIKFALVIVEEVKVLDELIFSGHFQPDAVDTQKDVQQGVKQLGRRARAVVECDSVLNEPFDEFIRRRQRLKYDIYEAFVSVIEKSSWKAFLFDEANFIEF
jgi:hypothetical protein